MILAPATMAKEKDAKEAARKCLEEVGLDPDSYRVGHTKARTCVLSKKYPPCVSFIIVIYYLYDNCQRRVQVLLV